MTAVARRSRGAIGARVRSGDALRLGLAAACWGVGTVLSKQALAEVPAATLLALQLAISVLFLAAASAATGVMPRLRTPIAALGLLNPGLAYALSLVALTTLSASVAVLLWALEPILIIAFAIVFLRERVTAPVIGLSAVAVAGIAAVTFDPHAAAGGVGIVVALAAVSCCAAYTTVTRRWLPGADSTIEVVVGQQAWALGLVVVMLGIVALAGWQVAPANLSPAGAASAIISGLVYYALAYWFYLGALRNVRASSAAISFYLIPVFGIGAAYLAGDRLAPAQWIGALVVVVAVALAAWRVGQPAIASGDSSQRSLPLSG